MAGWLVWGWWCCRGDSTLAGREDSLFRGMSGVDFGLVGYSEVNNSLSLEAGQEDQ